MIFQVSRKTATYEFYLILLSQSKTQFLVSSRLVQVVLYCDKKKPQILILSRKRVSTH